MEVEIRKRVDVNKIMADLNMVRADMCDDTLDTGEKERIENTCEEAALIITELAHQLRNTKEALEKYMEGEKLEEIPIMAGHPQQPKCFGKYHDENWKQCNFIGCKFRKFCKIEEEKELEWYGSLYEDFRDIIADSEDCSDYNFSECCKRESKNE